jgi:hypothetical protein
MSLRRKYLKILSEIVPAGAAGVSLLLGAAVPSAANPHPVAAQPPASGSVGVAERLAAIREAVSTVAGAEGTATPDDDNLRLAWGNWWHNWGWRPWGGWGWPNWNNWRNWHNWPNWWHNW